MQRKDKPSTIEELIKYLNNTYPSKTLGRGDFDISERAIWYQAGQRSVIDHIINLYNFKER